MRLCALARHILHTWGYQSVRCLPPKSASEAEGSTGLSLFKGHHLSVSTIVENAFSFQLTPSLPHSSRNLFSSIPILKQNALLVCDSLSSSLIA
jgi:hypothetical protein